MNELPQPIVNFQAAYLSGEPVLVLFDCDGTLIDSAAVIHEVMQRTFLQAGLPVPDIMQTKSIIGLSLELAIGRLAHLHEQSLKVAELTHLYKNFFVDFRKEAGFREPIFDGILELLKNLRATKNILCGVVTGKSRKGLCVVSKHYGFEWLIALSRTADDCPSKPNPAMVLECCDQIGIIPQHCLVMGDTSFDMAMAQSAGAIAIGVAWGYHSKVELFEGGASYVIDKPLDLLKLISGNKYA